MRLFTNYFGQYLLHVAFGRDSVILRRHCDTLCTSGFMDDVMFLYHGANGPKSSTTLCLEEVRHAASLPAGRQTTTVFGRVHQNAAGGGESVIYDFLINDGGGCDVADTAKRAAARRSETLKCPGKRNLKIVGVVPLNAAGRPASASVSVCPYLSSLLPVVQGKCNGRQLCKLGRRDVAVSKKQCPGVASVNFRVRCVKKGKTRKLCCRKDDRAMR